MKIGRVLMIVKKTSYERLRRTNNRKDTEMRRLLEQGHDLTLGVELAHEEHVASVRTVRTELRTRGIEVEERTSPISRPIGKVDLVISVGGDGTLLQASHLVLREVPLLGVNSAPAFSVGFLTGCRAPTFARVLDDLIADRVCPIEVQRLRVRIGRKAVPEPVLNDALFCHDNPAMTTRYRLIGPGVDEVQRSSGVWVATAAGSTAALRSGGGEPMPLTDSRFAFVVREPYAPPGGSVRVKGGVIEADQRLRIQCHTREAGIYLDGSYRRYGVPFGESVTFSLHDRPLYLVRPGA